MGVAGKDILLEYEPEVFELLDLDMGKCRMAVAAPKGFRDKGGRTLRVATKFPNIAQKYYGEMGRDIDIIKAQRFNRNCADTRTFRRYRRHCGNRHHL